MKVKNCKHLFMFLGTLLEPSCRTLQFLKIFLSFFKTLLLYNSKNSSLASFKTNLKINLPTREKNLPKRKEKKPPPAARNQVFSPNCSINLVKLCYTVISRRWTVLDQASEQ
jgi:hypothetical protein